MENVEIHFLVKKNFASIVSSNPHIDKVFEFDNDFFDTISNLKKEEYDYIIDLQKNFKSFKIKQALGIKSSSFNKLNIEKWLYVNFKINRLPSVHIVDRYMEAISALDIRNDGLGLEYFIPDKDVINIDSINAGKFKDYVALVIGAAHETKKMPIHLWKQLVEGMHFPYVVLGGKDDFENGEVLTNVDPKRSFNACGKFNLHQSASFVRQAVMVITHDTGLMHIAAAFKKPIISIWGNTVPEFGMYPYYGNQNTDQIVFQNNNLSCRPCSKIGHEKCPQRHFKCMEDQKTNEIISALNRMFKSTLSD